MQTAVELEVGRMSGPGGIGHRVVGIAHGRIAPGPTAGQVAPPDELGESGRWSIAGLRALVGKCEGLELGGGRHASNRLSRLNAELGQIPRGGAARDEGGLLGEQVNHHRRCATGAECRTVW